MIPKIIHFVWVGGKPLTPLAERCIETWKKYCPDYEIKRWDETNFDINANRYCREAYESKKWAFVSDYIRVKVLYEFGGIYMDTDVEVTKNLNKFLHHPAFSGFENATMIPTGIMASEKGNLWMKNLLSYYDNRSFYINKKELDLTTNVVSITETTKKMYPNMVLEGKYLELKDVVFYPKDYFCPIDYETGECLLTKNTHTIHHFSGSWVPKPNIFKRMEIAFKSFVKLIIGKKNTEKIKQKRKEKRERKINKEK